MVRSITSQPVSSSRLRACEGEISWSTSRASIAPVRGTVSVGAASKPACAATNSRTS